MQELAIKEYINQIIRRKNAVILFLVSVFLVTLITTLKKPKIYETYAVIEIGSETPDVAFFQDVVNTNPYGWWSAIRYYETQYSILKSRDFLSNAAKRAIEKGLVKGMSEETLISHMQGGLTVSPEENSRLARIYFEDTDPVRAQNCANAIAEAFVDENLSKKLKGVGDAVTWLNDRLKEVRQEKTLREEELLKKKREFKVVSLSDQENGAKNNLRALSESLNKLKSNRIELEAQYQKLGSLVASHKNTDDLLGVVQSNLLERLSDQLAQLKSKRTELMGRYLEKHPEMIKIDSQIAELGKIIRQEVSNEVSRLKTRYLLVKAEEESIEKAVESQKIEALKIDEVNREIGDVAMLTNANQQVYETLLRKLKEADLSSLVRSNNIRMVDKALLPGSPVSPNVQKNLLLALLFGLIGGVVLALLLEYIDDTLKNYEDIEQYIQEPMLGIIPRYEPAHLQSETSFSENPLATTLLKEPLAFLPHTEPQSIVSEFYRTLRTNMLFSLRDPNAKRVLFVSTGPGEGKTVTAINVSVALGQLGKKVLIVDLDFRRPKVHQVFNFAKNKGITNVLLNELGLGEAIQKSHIPNVSFLCAGSIPPNPAEILGSEELKNILIEVSKTYDYVMIDSAPIAPVTDAVIISQVVHSVVIVVRCAKTHRKAVMFAKEQLKSVHASIMGVVLNDVDIQRTSYSSYAYYKYGYAAYQALAEPIHTGKKAG